MPSIRQRLGLRLASVDVLANSEVMDMDACNLGHTDSEKLVMAREALRDAVGMLRRVAEMDSISLHEYQLALKSFQQVIERVK